MITIIISIIGVVIGVWLAMKSIEKDIREANKE